MRIKLITAISVMACTVSWAQNVAVPQPVKAQVKAKVQAATTELKQQGAAAIENAAEKVAPKEAHKPAAAQAAKVASPESVPQAVAQPNSEPAAVVQQAPAVKSKLSVARSAIALNIAENEPESPAEIFPPEVRRLYCFTHIKGAQGEAELQHRWYWNDDLIASIPLTVKSASWRTYSTKTIPSGMVGEWRVAVVDATSEEVIKMLKFQIK